MTEFLVIARVLHVLGVVVWIGGVAFVTTVVLPAVRRASPAQKQWELFTSIESRFVWQARVVTLITSFSGFLLLHGLDAWNRYRDVSFWWIHLMTLVWVLFALVLFVLEPLFLHRWFATVAERDPERVLRILQRLHWILLLVSLMAIVGGVAGVHKIPAESVDV